YRPGDNLYTDSALGINVDSGAIAWYFQYVPNESWDFDETGIHMLYDLQVNGANRRVVAHFGRNGFFYQLDRNNGAFINAGQYLSSVTWTKGLDPKTGKPIEYDPAKALQTYVSETRWSRGDEMKVV